MNRLTLLLVLLLWPLTPQAGMSDIDLKVREKVSDELDVNFNEIHSLRFAEDKTNCLFLVEARARDHSCEVCFNGTFKTPKATSVACERLWLFSDDEE